MKLRATTFLLVTTLSVGFLPGAAQCTETGTHRFARAASDSITPFIVLGMASISLDGRNGRHEEVQAAKALAATGLATELLKVTVREKRPNSDSRTGFPSGHASAAFAMATILSDYKPRLTIPAYAVAVTIGWSRVELRAHRWHDVAAGAALGYFIAKHYTGEHVSVSPYGVFLDWRL
jgi:membrane-associated phospholipid phosphatase